MHGRPTITRNQMLAEMEAATEPFALRFVKYSETKGTGGELVPLSGQLMSGRSVERLPGAKRAAPVVTLEPAPAKGKRNPHHYENMTRNLVSTINHRYTKLYIDLITEFNGKKVILT